MASKTQIANRALSKLGQPRVSNIDTTDTKPARVIADMYDSVRDALLSSYPWNFAVKRTTLAPDAVAPAWGWTNSYTPPADFLSIYRVKFDTTSGTTTGVLDTTGPQYEFEGGKILTDFGTTLFLQYISKITNTGEHSATFNEAFSARLAYEGAEEITQSNTKKERALKDYKMWIDEATRSDSKENPIEDLEDDEWVVARL